MFKNILFFCSAALYLSVSSLSAAGLSQPLLTSPSAVQFCKECDEGHRPDSFCGETLINKVSTEASICSWHTYKSNFGLEETTVKFPHKPTVTYGPTALQAQAYDGYVCYIFSAYFPPVGNIDHAAYFNQILQEAGRAPYQLLNYTISESADHGYWILDYTAHQSFQDLVLRSYTVVTPYNAYTVQALFPNGGTHSFDYFVNSLRINCKCGR